MNQPKDTVKVKTVSLPPNLWEIVDGKKDEWQTGRSAALRRIILEWHKNQRANKQKTELSTLAA